MTGCRDTKSLENFMVEVGQVLRLDGVLLERRRVLAKAEGVEPLSDVGHSNDFTPVIIRVRIAELAKP